MDTSLLVGLNMPTSIVETSSLLLTSFSQNNIRRPAISGLEGEEVTFSWDKEGIVLSILEESIDMDVVREGKVEMFEYNPLDTDKIVEHLKRCSNATK